MVLVLHFAPRCPLSRPMVDCMSPMSGRKWPPLSLPAGCALLAIGLALAYLGLAGFAWSKSGPDALRVVATAAVVCGASAVAALLVTGLMTGSGSGPMGILGGIVLGMGPPLVLAATVGFSGWLVVCFEIALVAQTLAALSVIAGRRPATVAGLNAANKLS